MKKLKTFFAGHPIFTTTDLRKFLGSSCKQKTFESLLSYHFKQGHIIRIRRGIYYVVPEGIAPETCPIDPYLVCSKLASDAILAYHTALAFFGKLHSVRNDFIYTTQQKVKAPFVLKDLTYKGVSPPQKLQQTNALDFEVEKTQHLNHNIQVTSLERTFVDVLDRPSLMGEWEEIWRSLESIEYLNLDKVWAYILLLENATTAAKVGFFLETHQESLMVPERFLEELSSSCSQQPHYLDRNHSGPQKLIKRWNLIIPQTLTERQWEEPHEDI